MFITRKLKKQIFDRLSALENNIVNLQDDVKRLEFLAYHKPKFQNGEWVYLVPSYNKFQICSQFNWHSVEYEYYVINNNRREVVGLKDVITEKEFKELKNKLKKIK